MKTIPLRVLILSLGAWTLSPVFAAGDAESVAAPSATTSRLWTDHEGRKVDAMFRGVKDGNVFLQTADGFVHRIPLDRLSTEDQEIARRMKPAGVGIPSDPNVAQAAMAIDRLVAAGLKKAGEGPNPLTNDEQFVRRLYLDLAGRIPTRGETIRFLVDKSDTKRARLIDTLVSGEGMNSRLFNYFADMLRMADDAQKSKFYNYEEWLKEQIAENRPWNEVVHDMMAADGKLLKNGATGYLLRDKGMRLDNLSLTLSTFLGANVACAQCHDHPFADWTQHQFYEMAAFFGASDTYNRNAARNLLGNLRNDLPRQQYQRAKRILDVNAMLVRDTNDNDLRLPEDYKYEDAKPGDAVSPKLIMWTGDDRRLHAYQEADNAMKRRDSDANLRDIFADWMTSPDNPRFAMTIANRMWKLMFGAGVKEPVEDLDDPSAASNPELLYHLADEMRRLKFDLRGFLRVVCNTQTYQREAVTKEVQLGESIQFAGPLLRRMTAEQAWDSCVTLAVGEKVDAYKLRRAEAYTEAMNIDFGSSSPAQVKEVLLAKIDAGGKSAAKGKGKKKTKGKKKNSAAQTSSTAVADASEEGGAAEAEYVKPEMFGSLVLARASELPQPERDSHFLRMFGQSDRQIADSNSDEGSIPQVLMLMNGAAQKVLRDSSSVAMSTALSQEKPEARVQALYVSFLGRNPRPEEMKDALAAVNDGLGLEDLAWVLFNTREFVFVQ